MYESAPLTHDSPVRAPRTQRPAVVAAPRPARRIGERPRVVLMDAAVVGGATALAGTPADATATGLVVGSTVAALAAVGVYRPRLSLSALDEAPRVLLGVAAAWAVVCWMGATSTPAPALPGARLWWPAGLAAGVTAGRYLTYKGLRRRRRRLPGERAVIVGSGEIAARLAEALLADPEHGLSLIGFVGQRHVPVDSTQPLLPVLGQVDDLTDLVDRYGVRYAVVAFPGKPDAELVARLRECRQRDVTVLMVPRLFELEAPGPRVELVRGIPLVRMRPFAPHTAAWWAKRAVDVAGALTGLVLLAPVMAACALAVRLETGKDGILFRQERIGRDGRRFAMLKFRSLTPSSELEPQVRWTIATDARIGPVGRFLRRTSLDELPQLLNVLRGDMSLVGPRPERPYFVEEFRRVYGGYAERHRVPGGITGWAQVHGLRGDTSIEERARYDNFYIENWSLALDIKIIVRTVLSTIRGG